MNITDIRIRHVKTEGKLKAIVSVTLDDAIVIHDIKIIDGHRGLFIAMPSRKVAEGDFRDIVHPINTETRSYFQDSIFKVYEESKEELDHEPEPFDELDDSFDEEVYQEDVLEESTAILA